MHPSANHVIHQFDGGMPEPLPPRGGIDPHQFGKVLLQSGKPHLTRLLVPLLDTAARPSDLVGAHGGIPHQDHPVVAAIGAQQPQGIEPLLKAAGVILLDEVVEAVVKIEVLQMLELVAQRREEALHLGHVGIHGASHIEKDQ